MSKRIQLTQDIHMNLDGQPQIVLSGSVLDVPDSFMVSVAQATTLVEASAAVTKPTSVRGVRVR